MHRLQWRPQLDRPPVGTIGAKDQAKQFGAPRADQAGDTEDLPPAYLKGHLAHGLPPAQPSDAQ